MAFPLFYNIIKGLNDQLSPADDDEFFSQIQAKTIDELSEKLNSSIDKARKKLIAVVMLQKLGSDEVDISHKKYFTQLHDIISEYDELKADCYDYLDSYLRKYILETKTFEEMYSLAQIAIEVKNFKSDLVEAFICIENQAANFSYDLLIEMMENHKESSALTGAKYLKKLSKLGFDVALSSEIFTSGTVEFIEERNDLRRSDLNLDKNIQNDYKLINKLMETKMSQDDQNKLLEVRGKLNGIEPEDPNYKSKSKNRPILFTEYFFDTNDKEIDMTQLSKNFVINEINFSDFTLVVNSGRYGNIPVIIKHYSLKSNDNSRKQEIIDKINIEAKCMKYLKEKIVSSKLFFLDFYYKIIDQNNYYLVQQNQSRNLEEYRKAFKSSSIPSHSLMNIVKNLLNAFNELENRNIYHQNISLKSILINDFNITVVDFYYAVHKKEGYRLVIDEDMNRRNYYRPEMKDSSVNDPGKMDVYALGLVILQLADSELLDISKKENIEDSLNAISVGWQKELLEKMLKSDIKDIYYFRNLHVEIEEILSKTNSEISSYQSVVNRE